MPSLVLEDGTGLTNANSFSSVIEGDIYHVGSLYSDVWFSAGTALVGAGAISPESGSINLAQDEPGPIEITFDNEKANDDYEPYIYFSSSGGTPEIIDWVVTAQTTEGMTIAINPSPSGANMVLHWRVFSINADPNTIVSRKETALIMATRVISYNTEWYGYKRTVEQALEWPRIAVRRQAYVSDYRDAATILSSNLPFTTTGPYWPSDAIPKAVKDATCEMALELLRKDRTAEPSQKGVTRFSLGQGAISADFDKSDRAQTLSEQVMFMLEPFGQSRANRMMVRLVGV